jgi:hypothetical protein
MEPSSGLEEYKVDPTVKKRVAVIGDRTGEFINPEPEATQLFQLKSPVSAVTE